jgi:hypothetical protein
MRAMTAGTLEWDGNSAEKGEESGDFPTKAQKMRDANG